MKKNDQRFLAYAVAFATSFVIIPGMASAADAAVNATSSDTATVNNTQAADQVAAENSVKNAKAAESAKDSQTDERTKEWNKNRPEESAVNDSLKQYEGQTIVDTVFEGTSASSETTAKAALAMRTGDMFTANGLLKDRDAVYNTGYFYDLYPSFKQVPEGVIFTYH